MSLDHAFRTFRGRLRPPDLSLPVRRMREHFFRTAATTEPDMPELAEVRMLSFARPEGAMRMRLYIPLGAGHAPGPGIVFFHGGGFVLGDLGTHDMICRRLAESSLCRVLAIDYRLAPEWRFPAAHEDALESWLWLNRNGPGIGIDPGRAAVAGDSAGGNLAAYVCQEMKRRGGPLPAFQLLLYPLLQFADLKAKKMPPQESGLFLSVGLFEYFRNHYLPDPGTYMDRRVCPLFSPPEELRGLPAAHIVTCGWDPLHDEGQVYAARLRSVGVAVTERDYASMMHGFLNLSAFSGTARSAAREAGEVTGRALGAG